MLPIGTVAVPRKFAYEFLGKPDELPVVFYSVDYGNRSPPYWAAEPINTPKPQHMVSVNKLTLNVVILFLHSLGHVI